MRDKLLALVYRFSKWRYKTRLGDLISLKYIGKLLDYIEYDQIERYYKPSVALRTTLTVNHRNAASLMSRFSDDLEVMKQREYIKAVSYQNRLINLDDWLVDNLNRPYDAVAYINLIKTYVKTYRNLLERIKGDSEWTDYYRRRMNNHLEDIVVLLETILEITH